MWQVSDEMRSAIRDFSMLLDKGYPEKASIALVGDRYRLGKDDRLILFRGVASAANSALRAEKLRKPLGGETVILDAYNAAFGIVHYLIGKPCFISTDGYMRDAGASYGRIPREDIFEKALSLIADALKTARVEVIACFDAPVSKSASHSRALGSMLSERSVPHESSAVKSADGRIRSILASRNSGASADSPPSYVVASADSAIIDAAGAAWDVPAEIVTDVYGASLVRLQEAM